MPSSLEVVIIHATGQVGSSSPPDQSGLAGIEKWRPPFSTGCSGAMVRHLRDQPVELLSLR